MSVCVLAMMGSHDRGNSVSISNRWPEGLGPLPQLTAAPSFGLPDSPEPRVLLRNLLSKLETEAQRDPMSLGHGSAPT